MEYLTLREQIEPEGISKENSTNSQNTNKIQESNLENEELTEIQCTVEAPTYPQDKDWHININYAMMEKTNPGSF